jgi:DNA-binding LacI/PurR family transcriptional regulator
MAGQRVTLATIADRLGVSRSTVSNAYNRPDQLSDELRRRIMAAAAELGYAGPDPAARSLRIGQAGAIGIVQLTLHYAVTDAANGLLLDGIAEVCEEHGLALVLIPERRPHSGRVDVLATALIDGVIVHCDALDRDRRAVVEARQLPLVVLDGASGVDDTNVGIDDAGGAAMAAEHVLGLGHRSIAVVTWGHRAEDYNLRTRLEGYRRAVDGAGVNGLTVVDAASYERVDGKTAAVALLTGAERPTAILAMSDELAAGVVDAAHELAIDVPGELSVVGFDDSASATTTVPPLTTSHQDHREKGRVAAQVLLDTRRAGQRVQLPVNLVVRSSTAPPRR